MLRAEGIMRNTSVALIPAARPRGIRRRRINHLMILVKILSGLFWTAVTGLTLYLANDVINTEPKQHVMYGWLGACFLFFLAATLLSYLMISAGKPPKQS